MRRKRMEPVAKFNTEERTVPVACWSEKLLPVGIQKNRKDC
jgi:hypothetical protein